MRVDRVAVGFRGGFGGLGFGGTRATLRGFASGFGGRKAQLGRQVDAEEVAEGAEGSAEGG